MNDVVLPGIIHHDGKRCPVQSYVLTKKCSADIEQLNDNYIATRSVRTADAYVILDESTVLSVRSLFEADSRAF
jgi:hypothetical protein